MFRGEVTLPALQTELLLGALGAGRGGREQGSAFLGKGCGGREQGKAFLGNGPGGIAAGRGGAQLILDLGQLRHQRLFSLRRIGHARDRSLDSSLENSAYVCPHGVAPGGAPICTATSRKGRSQLRPRANVPSIFFTAAAVAEGYNRCNRGDQRQNLSLRGDFRVQWGKPLYPALARRMVWSSARPSRLVRVRFSSPSKTTTRTRGMSLRPTPAVSLSSIRDARRRHTSGLPCGALNGLT